MKEWEESKQWKKSNGGRKGLIDDLNFLSSSTFNSVFLQLPFILHFPVNLFIRLHSSYTSFLPPFPFSPHFLSYFPFLHPQEELEVESKWSNCNEEDRQWRKNSTSYLLPSFFFDSLSSSILFFYLTSFLYLSSSSTYFLPLFIVFLHLLPSPPSFHHQK